MAKILQGIKATLAVLFWLAVVALVLSYLLQTEPGNEDGCSGSLVPDPRQGVTCVSRTDAIETQATMEREIQEDGWDDQYRSDEATRQAEWGAGMLEMERREREEAREDAVRACILAGNNGDLCKLNPWDPYGMDDRDS